jgi:iron complex outermembrane receptor protein
MRIRKPTLLALPATLQLLLIGGVNAQTSAAPPPAAADTGQTTSKSSGYELEEVMVTAEKISQDAQKVALPIVTVTQETLSERGVDSARDLQKVVAGLQALGTTGNFAIRGVKTQGVSPLATAAVAYSQDGVTLGRFQNSANLVYDIDRVEVLKGPQGSLSGTNASGGSISVISRKPVLGRFEGNGSIELGNYSTLRTTGALNLPIGDKAALRMAWGTARHEGYYDNAPAVDRGTADVQSGRLRLLVAPTDALSITLGVQYQTDKGTTFVRPICYSATDANCPYGADDERTYPLNPAAAPVYNAKTWGAMADVEWDLGFATLTILPSYNQYKSVSSDSAGYTLTGSNTTSSSLTNTSILAPVTVFPVGHEDFSQKALETRLAHAGETFKWVVGGITQKEENVILTGLGQVTTTPAYYRQTKGPQNTENKALFGQATYSITDTLRITGGTRYSVDSKLDGLIACNNGNPISDPNPANHPITPVFTPAMCVANISSYEMNYWTYRGTVEYDLRPESMLYTSVSTGLHPGSINSVQTPLALRYVKPEKLTNYELGSKNRFFDGQLQLNASVFYLDYKDYQVSYTFNESPAIGGTLNAAAAVNKGVDFDVIYLPTWLDRINFSGQYLSAKFTDFNIFTQTCAGCAFSNVNYDGKTEGSSPELIFNLGYEHTFDLPNGGTLVPRVDGHYESSQKIALFQEFAITRQDAYAVADVTATYNSPQNNWRVTGYVRNVTDKAYLTNITGGNGFITPLRVTANISDPRTYGVRLEASF